MAQKRSIEEAPGPSGFGLVRTLHGLRTDPLATFERAAERFGPILAFGVGPRGCAGAGFAVDEMTLALAELLARFRLGVATKVAARAGVTLRTRVPLFARVTSVEAR